MSSRPFAQRSLALAAALSVALGGTASAGFLRRALAADDAAPALKFNGFVHGSDLTLPDGTTHPDARSLTMVGADDGLGVVAVIEKFSRAVFLLNLTGPEALKQRAVIPFTTTPSVTTLDPSTHRVYLGTQVSGSSGVCGAVALACSSGPKAATPQVEALDLAQRSSVQLYTLPSWAAGYDIVALTPTTSAAGRHVLLALLYRAGVGGDTELVHDLTLAAFDSDVLAAGQSDPTLWHHDISDCASLLSWNTNNTGLSREFLGIDPAGRFTYFGCRGTIPSGAGHLAPAGAYVVDLESAAAANDLPASAASFTDSFYPYGASSNFASTAGDSAHGLLEFATIGAGDLNKLYVFDAVHRAWTGSMPFAAAVEESGEPANKNLWGVANDPSTGRAYIYYPMANLISSELTRLPVPQGVVLPLGDLKAASGASFPLVDPGSHQIFLPQYSGFSHRDGTVYPDDDSIAVYQDTRAVPAADTPDDPDALTHDAPLGPDTPVTYGSFASAYGAKAILVGGAHSLPAMNQFYGNLAPSNLEDNECANTNGSAGAAGAHAPCEALIPNASDGDRSFTFGQVSRTELSNSAASSEATTMSIDDATNADGTSMSSYNPADEIWNRIIGPDTGQDRPSALPGPPPPPDTSQQTAPSGCKDFNGKKSAPTGPGSAVSCDYTGQQARGAAASDALAGLASGGSAAPADPNAPQSTPVQVAYAASATQAGHTLNNQAVTQAVATSRGISLAIPSGPTVTIGEVTTTATSTAAGVKDGAKSTFTRRISNLVVRDPSGAVLYSCGFGTDAGAEANSDDCDPRQLTAAVSSNSPSPVLFRMPRPDDSVRASRGGAQAEVIKSQYQFWNDYFTNADNSWEVPGLQVLFVGDQDQPSRLVLNLAAVHVESHDTIGLAPPPLPELPAPSLQLTLLDGSTPPVPLSGATFTLTGPEGVKPVTCLTAADGIGTCKLTKLSPGAYTIAETTAPPGYAPVEDYKLTLEAGKDYKTSFVNLPAIGSVELTLLEPGESATPLPGGVFALHKGTSLLETPLVTCTTDDKGACAFDKVPLGDYTMEQVTAPEGFLVSDPVQFSLTKPTEVAKLRFVDGVPGKAAVPPTVIPGKPAVPPKVIPGKPAVPARVIPGTPAVPPHTMVLPALDGGTGEAALEPAGYDTASGPAPVVASQPSGALDALSLGSGGLTAASARLARLALHSPQQAALLLFVWLVLGLPVYLWVRRRQFIIATEGI